jgi:RecA-family ATPase
VMARVDSLCEVSPSGGGVKIFCLVRLTDKAQLEALFNGMGGRLFKRANGVRHPPSIEIYRTNRYFTVTGETISMREDLRVVSIETIRWIIVEAGPKLAGKAKDDSRSAKAYRLAAALKASGSTYEEIRAALLSSDDPDIVSWTLEKGIANGERELRRLFDHAGKPSDEVVELPVVSAASFAGAPAPPRAWHVLNMVPGEQVTLLSGDGGVGKSIIGIQLAVATVTGREWLGMAPARGPVVLLSAEEDRKELNRRVESVAANYGVGLEELSDFHLIPLAGLDAVLAAPMKPGVMTPTAVWRGLVAIVERIKPCLVIIDTLADCYAGNENARPEVRQFVGLLRGMAIEQGLALVLLAHPSLSGIASGSGSSGSTAWSNSVRSRLYLDKVKDVDGADVETDLRILSTKKLNYGPDTLKLQLRWSEGCFVLDGPAGSLDKAALEAKAERVFLGLLASFAAQGRDVSPSPGATYGPSTFEKHPGALGVTRKAFVAAMERLLMAGKIIIETYGPPSKRYRRLALPAGRFV